MIKFKKKRGYRCDQVKKKEDTDNDCDDEVEHRHEDDDVVEHEKDEQDCVVAPC